MRRFRGGDPDRDTLSADPHAHGGDRADRNACAAHRRAADCHRSGGLPTPTADYTQLDFTEDRSFSSPDGQWIAHTIIALPTGSGSLTEYYTYLAAERADGSATAVAVDTWSNYGLGYTTPKPYRWSADGMALYFTDYAVPDGCGPAFIDGWSLRRLDLADGSVVDLLPQNAGWAIALSPDEGMVAYAGGAGLTLRDLATGEERVVPLEGDPYADAGSIVWAPDQSAVAFTLAENACGPDRTHSILRLDTESLELSTLYEEGSDSPHLLQTVDWPAAGRITLQAADGAQWSMDSVTGALIPSG